MITLNYLHASSVAGTFAVLVSVSHLIYQQLLVIITRSLLDSLGGLPTDGYFIQFACSRVRGSTACPRPPLLALWHLDINIHIIETFMRNTVRVITSQRRDTNPRPGTVVRVAPNELSFIGPDAWEDIYGIRVSKVPCMPQYNKDNRTDSCAAERGPKHGEKPHLYWGSLTHGWTDWHKSGSERST
jgi:hypothetical protein